MLGVHAAIKHIQPRHRGSKEMVFGFMEVAPTRQLEVAPTLQQCCKALYLPVPYRFRLRPRNPLARTLCSILERVSYASPPLIQHSPTRPSSRLLRFRSLP